MSPEGWCQGQARSTQLPHAQGSTRSALLPSLIQPVCCATKFLGACMTIGSRTLLGLKPKGFPEGFRDTTP